MKCDNIEHYSLRTLDELKKSYDEFIKKSGSDPDFPSMNFGDKENINIGANQLSSFIDGDGSDAES